MAARGDHAGAEDEFRDMLPHLRRRLGPDHPDTLAAAEWIDYIRGKRPVARSSYDAVGRGSWIVLAQAV